MSVKFCWTRRVVIFLGLFAMMGFVASCGLLFPGVPGPTGPEGPAGDQGPEGPQGPSGDDGLDAGAALPLTVVTITDVSGASPVVVGGPLNVTFTIEDDSGNTIALSDLDRFSIYVSGPSDNYQRVITPQSSMTPITQNPDESYTYSFATFPSTYANPVNTTTGGGGAVAAGTYTVGIEARRTFTVEGASVRKAGDATLDFAVDGATLSARQVVTQANCENCHAQMTMHGGNRFKLTGCVLCHTTGAEDKPSVANPTTGLTIRLAEMIHRLHRGADLPRVKATANSADPYRYEVIGYGESVHDFSDVGFPFMPGGVMECAACHGAAAQEGLIHADDSINQANCRTCHDDIDFTTGTILNTAHVNVAGGLLAEGELSDLTYRTTPGGVAHVFPDGSCLYCHGAGAAYAVQTVHQHETSTEQEGIGLRIEIVGVGGMTGGGGAYFVAGDLPVVTFKLTDADGNARPVTDVHTVAFVVAGPTTLYQHIIPGDTASRVRPWNAGVLKAAAGSWVDNFAVDGTYTYTFEAAPNNTASTVWPTNYPAARNSLSEGPPQEFPFAQGWGQLYTAAGTPLDNGTYTIVAYARRQTATKTEGAPGDTWDVLYGAAGTVTPYGNIVTDEKCGACHGLVRAHDDRRVGVRTCLACHTPGAQDNAPEAGDDPAADNLDMRVMIHKLHNARNLDVVAQGGSYDLQRHARYDYSHVLLPSMPGETKHCTACHATDAWKAPVERAGVNIWKVACTSCHDSAAVAAHVALNTWDDDGDPTTPGIEGCATCHHDGGAFSVETMHASP